MNSLQTKEQRIKLIDLIVNNRDKQKNIEHFVNITKNASLVNKFLKKLRPTVVS